MVRTGSVSQNMPWGENTFSHVFMLLLICFFCMCVCFAISSSIWVSLGVRRNVCSPAFIHFLYLLCSASFSNFLISSIFSDTCELATSLFKIVGVYLASLLCFHPFFTAPSHTALLEFLSLSTLA